MVAIVYMVAGMSSRFGGRPKQLAKVGPNNETLIEYLKVDLVLVDFDLVDDSFDDFDDNFFVDDLNKLLKIGKLKNT